MVSSMLLFLFSWGEAWAAVLDIATFVAPAMAPHFVCPSTSTSRVPRQPTAYSTLPTMLPSAPTHVFPAFRSTKSSPGCASKSVSTGHRESAQPMTTAEGFWPKLAKVLRSSLLWRLVMPTVLEICSRYLRLPCLRDMTASSADEGSWFDVRGLTWVAWVGVDLHAFGHAMNFMPFLPLEAMTCSVWHWQGTMGVTSVLPLFPMAAGRLEPGRCGSVGGALLRC
mmetsp:Transcript_48473/g.154824  ORF Transcript_48473/g.154824 Transcript_48473/m.154824 type:complete len:224 (+) Transcript_48473:242-913(+)